MSENTINESWRQAPIGMVIMWWGDRDRPPTGWEICDGTLPHPQSWMARQMPGVHKPQFMNHFAKGAPESKIELGHLERGGNNNIPAHYHGVGNATTNHSGAHSHDVWVRTGHSDVGPDNIVSRGEDRHVHENHISGKAVASGDSNHSHGLTGTIGALNTADGDGNDRDGKNQPQFQEIFFIIFTGRPPRPAEGDT